MKKLIILSVILLAAGALHGQIIRIPADRATIQKGIDAANAGDTVLVSPGTYVENINYNGKNITLASLFLTTKDTSYISRTIIDGNKTGSAVRFFSEIRATGVLSGFTITNGSDHGIYCYKAGPVLENLIISGNSALSGGGIYCGWNSAPTLKNVTITNNTALWQGGGFFFELTSQPAFDPINRCNIYLNSAQSGNDLYSESPFTGSPITVILDTFTILNPNAFLAYPLSGFTFDILHGKVAQADSDLFVSPGGDDSNSGLTPDDPLKNIRIACSIILADSLHPRTIHLLEGTYSPSTTNEQFPVILPEYISLAGVNATTVIVDAEGTNRVFQFENNNSSNLSGMTIKGGSAGTGGGIYCNNSSPSIMNVTITGNAAYGGWGNGSGAGIYCYNSSPILENVTITNNTGTWVNGGGMYCGENSAPVLKNVMIANNKTSGYGGGIYFYGSSPVFDSISRCNIYSNTAGKGNDLYAEYSTIKVIVDTFTVLKPQAYHAFPLSSFTFDILHGKIAQIDADVYVSPDGDDSNSGLTPDDPLKTIGNVLPVMGADSLHPRTIHLLKGKYSPSTTQEKFPVILPDYISLAGGDDTTVIVDAEGSGRVFQFDNNNSSQVSGLTITGGSGDSGGGISCSNSSPILENVMIAGNIASGGGGIACWGSRPVLRNVTIINNTASSVGGGLFFSASVPVFDSINRCNIFFNTAPEGNDLYSYSPIKVIVDTFTVLKPQAYHAFPLSNFKFDILHGKVTQAEADVYISPDGDDSHSGLTPDDPLKTIAHVFSIIIADSLHPRTIHLLNGTYSPSKTHERFPVVLPDYISLAGINDTTVIVDAEGTGSVFQFRNNSTSRVSGITITGGLSGVSCDYSSPILENVTITKNTNSSGGGIYCNYSGPVIRNSIIAGNSASQTGGGVYCINSSPSLENVTLSGNSALNGGGMYTTRDSCPVMRGVTVANNSATGSGGGIYLENSIIAFDSINRCNIYFNRAPAGNDLYGYGISHNHVVLDTFSVLRPTDYYAEPVKNFSFDILHGKLNQVQGELYVSPAGDNSNTGQSDADPLRSINHAMRVLYADSQNPGTIHLMQGTYGPSYTGETMPVVMQDYVSLMGNDKSNTTLSAEGAPVTLQFQDNDASVVSGLTVTGAGSAGISFNNSDATLQDMIVRDNSGTGLVLTGDNSGALLKDVIISGNSGEYGGGMNISGTSPEFRNVVVRDNFAVYGGGAYCGATISGVFFSDNMAKYGGAIYISPFIETAPYSAYPRPMLINLVIDHNIAQSGGGIFVSAMSYNNTPILKNVTCTENIALLGGGIYLDNESRSMIYNTILWNNYPQEAYADNSYFSVHYSNLRGGETGILNVNNSNIRWNKGILDADPLFKGSGDHPYALSAGSPCIDVGTTVTGQALPAWDILGNNRHLDGNGDSIVKIDMGAYEFVAGATGMEEMDAPGSALQVRTYPNPFSSFTTIEYQLSESGEVSLTIYNNIGQPMAALVREYQPQGIRQVEWNAAGLPPGIYYFRLTAGNQGVTRRILKI